MVSSVMKAAEFSAGYSEVRGSEKCHGFQPIFLGFQLVLVAYHMPLLSPMSHLFFFSECLPCRLQGPIVDAMTIVLEGLFHQVHNWARPNPLLSTYLHDLAVLLF